jgi:flagellar motor protein MotB
MPFILQIVMTCLCMASVQAQDERDSAMRYSAWAAGALDMHAADFAKFTDVGFCCPSDFGAQSGYSVLLGGSFRFAPLPSVSRDLLLDARLGVGYSSVSMSTTESTLFNDPSGGANTSVEASFDYVISSSWMSTMIDVLPSYRITSGLTVHTGLRAAVTFADEYEQTERITDAYAEQGFVFTDTQSPERNVASGEIPGLATMQWSILAGVSWEFPLNREGTTFLAPELFYVHGLNDVSDGVSHADGSAGSWTRSSIQAGLSVRFATGPTIRPDPCDTIINGVVQAKTCPDGQVLAFDAELNTCTCRDTMTVVDSVLVRIDSVIPIGVSGSAAGRQDLIVEQFKVRHWIPTLPFVYFAARSSELDLVDDYRDVTPQQRISFDIEPAFERDIYRHALNIIGKRLFMEPTATIRITGHYSASDGEDNALAQERAYSVRDYLYQQWGVAFDRMTVVGGSTRTLDPRADIGEARCVEISASKPSILAPIEMPESEVVIRPSAVLVASTIKPGAGRSVASIAYALRVGGGSGARPKPLAQTFNVGSAGFDGAMHGWTADVGARESRILAAVKGQLDATDLVVMPSVEVTLSTGQRIVAEQDVRATTLSMVPLTPETKRTRALQDTVELRYDVVFTTPNTDRIDTAVIAALQELLPTVPTSVPAVLMPTDDGSIPADRELMSRRREAVRRFLQNKGYQVIDGVERVEPVDAGTDARTSAYRRRVQVVFRVPVR